MYRKLYKMCGWSDEEIDKHQKRIETVMERIDMKTERDYRIAEKHVAEQFELDFPGVKGLLRILIHNFMDCVLAKDEHDIYIAANYPILPPITLGYGKALKRCGREKEIFIMGTTQAAIYALGLIFKKYHRVLEAGELHGHPAGKAHCAQYQAEIGLVVLGILPKPDFCLTSGWFCDQGAECDEMLSQKLGWESINLDGAMDFSWEGPENGDPVERKNVLYSAGTLKKALKRFEEIAGVEIIDEDQDESWDHFGNIAVAVLGIIQQVAEADPQPISHGICHLANLMAFVTPHDEQLTEDAIDALNEMSEAVNDRIEEEIGILPKGAPKVYVSSRIVPDNQIIHGIEGAGLSIATMFMDGMASWETQLPMFPDGEMSVTATEYFFKRPGANSLLKRCMYQLEQMEEFNCDGAIINFCFNCRPWVIDGIMNKDYLEKHTGKPILMVEADYYDVRNYSREQMRTRIESYAEVLKLNKAREAAA